MRRIGTVNIKEILHHRHGLGLTRAQTATHGGGEHGHGLAHPGAGGGLVDHSVELPGLPKHHGRRDTAGEFIAALGTVIANERSRNRRP